MIRALVVALLVTTATSSPLEEAVAAALFRDCTQVRDHANWHGTYTGDQLCPRPSIDSRMVRGCLGPFSDLEGMLTAITTHDHLPCWQGIQDVTVRGGINGSEPPGFLRSSLAFTTTNPPPNNIQPVLYGVTTPTDCVGWIALLLCVGMMAHGVAADQQRSLPLNLGRRLVRYLRHVADKDDNGWCTVQQVCQHLGVELSEEDIEDARLSDNKRRIEVDWNSVPPRLRARMGHTIPVALRDMPDDDSDLCYHVTSIANVNSIIQDGIRRTRTWVHAFPAPARPEHHFMWPARRNPCVVEFDTVGLEKPRATQALGVKILLFAECIPPHRIVRITNTEGRVIYERPAEEIDMDIDDAEDQRILPPSKELELEYEDIEYERKGVTKQGRRAKYAPMIENWFYQNGVRFTNIVTPLSQCDCCGQIAICRDCHALPEAEDTGARRLAVQCECQSYGSIEALGSRAVTSDNFGRITCQCTFASVFDPDESALQGTVSMKQFGPCLRDHVRREPISW